MPLFYTRALPNACHKELRDQEILVCRFRP
nr:MAG TPA: hypothetical protein [Caudoviricetes sp.]DAK52028.1 MAG TPA: hypothetical protein [Caudoviricetes sp.]DAZ00923.1 MAG TPA: hypothetical protein [Caudoviricetes sp.]